MSSELMRRGAGVMKPESVGGEVLAVTAKSAVMVGAVWATALLLPGGPLIWLFLYLMAIGFLKS